MAQDKDVFEVDVQFTAPGVSDRVGKPLSWAGCLRINRKVFAILSLPVTALSLQVHHSFKVVEKLLRESCEARLRMNGVRFWDMLFGATEQETNKSLSLDTNNMIATTLLGKVASNPKAYVINGVFACLLASLYCPAVELLNCTVDAPKLPVQPSAASGSVHQGANANNGNAQVTVRQSNNKIQKPQSKTKSSDASSGKQSSGSKKGIQPSTQAKQSESTVVEKKEKKDSPAEIERKAFNQTLRQAGTDEVKTKQIVRTKEQESKFGTFQAGKRIICAQI